MATETLQRWARICHAEAVFAAMDHDNPRQARQIAEAACQTRSREDGARYSGKSAHLSKPLWEEFEAWLKLQRAQVLDGSEIAAAI